MSRYDWAIDSAKRYNIKQLDGYSTRLFKYVQGYFDWGYEWGQDYGFKKNYELFLAVYCRKDNPNEVLYKAFKRPMVHSVPDFIPVDMKVLSLLLGDITHCGNPNKIRYVEIEKEGYAAGTYEDERRNIIYEVSSSEWGLLMDSRSSSAMMIEKHPEFIPSIEGFNIVNSISMAYSKAKEVIELLKDVHYGDFSRSVSIDTRNVAIDGMKKKKEELNRYQNESLRIQEEGMNALNELEEKWGIVVEV